LKEGLIAREGMNIRSADTDSENPKQRKSRLALRHFYLLQAHRTRLITYPLLHEVEINNFN
jgi:hypothetical protein